MNILFTSMNSEPIAIKLIAIGEPTTGANKYTTDTLTSSQQYTIGNWITTEGGFINFDYRGKSVNESNYYKFITSGGDIAISGNFNNGLDYYYYNMFKDSKEIIDATSIQLTPFAVGEHGAQNMFANCTNLTGVPSKFPRWVNNWCYAGMFANCTSLKEFPAILSRSNTGTFAWMFQNCTALTSAPVLSSFNTQPFCCNGMFQNCISLKEAPVITYSPLSEGCYKNMFMDCKSLSSITIGFDNWNKNNTTAATENWVKGVSYSGTFNKPKQLSAEFGPSRIPNGWDVNNN